MFFSYFFGSELSVKIIMSKGIGCIYKYDQQNWPYPSPNTTFVVPKFSDTFALCFATKTIKQQKLQLEGKHLIARTNIKYYAHSEIISLGTLNAMFMAFLHAWYTLYNIGDEQG